MYDTVLQTIPYKWEPSKMVEDSWTKYFNGKRIILNDDECKQFLGTYYGQSYVDKFDYLEKGAHKADLFRYAWLYKNGGIYCDIKTVLIRPITEVFPDDTVCYFVDTRNPHCEWFEYKRLYNGVIATPPLNPIMYDMLHGAMRYNNTEHYHTICRDGYRVISSYMHQTKLPLGRVPSINPNIPDIHLYYENIQHICNVIEYDRAGYCSFIVNENGCPMMKVRDHTYKNITISERTIATLSWIKNWIVNYFFTYIVPRFCRCFINYIYHSYYLCIENSIQTFLLKNN